MGLIMGDEHMGLLKRVAERERSPLYEVGEVTGDKRFTFKSELQDISPMDLEIKYMFGSSPKTIMNDKVIERDFKSLATLRVNSWSSLNRVLQLEAVACKDWLTNKVDRCVGGLVAKQQCAGPLQLPLNNCGVMALDFEGKSGIATSIGHSPISGLIDPGAASRNSVAEALTNIIWGPLEKGSNPFHFRPIGCGHVRTPVKTVDYMTRSGPFQILPLGWALMFLLVRILCL